MARTLNVPDTAKVHKIALKVVNVDAKRLVRISSHPTGEPPFWQIGQSQARDLGIRLT